MTSHNYFSKICLIKETNEQYKLLPMIPNLLKNLLHSTKYKKKMIFIFHKPFWPISENIPLALSIHTLSIVFLLFSVYCEYHYIW